MDKLISLAIVLLLYGICEILELKEAIKKAEAEWNTSDVEKLKKELRGLSNEGFLTKIFKSDGRY